MAELAPQGFSLATDIAAWLVRQGTPFRIAHAVAGACVRECESQDIELHELSDEQFAAIHTALTPGVRDVLTADGSVSSRAGPCGTAHARVREPGQEVSGAVADLSGRFRFR